MWGCMMQGLKRFGLFFIIGSLGYGLIEILWRGHTHWSMLIAGGLAFVMFSVVADRLYALPIALKAIICAVGITCIEFIFGVIFNIVLGMRVWDYSGIPFNLFGQVCLRFSLVWAGLSLVFLPLANLLNLMLKKIRTGE